ncbi:Glycosyltransferase involved in cell wall bisynthesis [Geoalkalibacter ferrihydriticus]|uniref:Glycosyltransferase involved in cell wall bisynthesis n=2 Tax=Geoalkalibacter ferrihydriticus TaxID=392333 RepID=A0A1G9WJ35_9BACT|nr:Glycosyltransferase involved in cell wall bisynthesis [Geoalkalibacter ferrihydriticus]
MAIQAEKLAALLREQGSEVVEVRTNGASGQGGAMARIPGVRSIINLARFLRDLDSALRRTDVVYFLSGFFNFYFWVTFPALLLIYARRKPVVLSARGGDAARFFRRYGKLVGPVLRRVDKITTPSGFLRDVFRDAFALEAQVIPNIADLDQFEFRRRDQFRPRLLVTRNLEQIYGIDTVLRAFALVREQHPDATLVIAGGGSLRAELEQLAAELKVDDAVTFHGPVSHAQIQRLYGEYDIYVNASRIDNLPGSLLEAFASGLPVVSTRAGGIPYMVEDGVTGMLVAVDDHQALAEQVLRIIDDPALGLALADAAYAESQKYARKNVAPQLVNLLAQHARP